MRYSVHVLSLFLLTLCFRSVPAVSPAKASSFFDCLRPLTPSFGPDSASFANLSKLNFRNNVATPSAIVLARIPAHVSDAVRCARRTGFKVCTRSGGHSLVGKSLCSGVLIDVGPMRKVIVDSNGIATVEAGINMGELLWALWQKKRWLAAGVCPGVGVGGYIFGGGHGPYEGKLGMACDSLVDVTLVDRFGKIITASKTSHSSLFWALCGAGGGQFGVVVSFRIRTASSRRYDRGVVFRFNWKQQYVGQLMEKWMDYDEAQGDVWFRMEMYKNREETGMYGFGACYDVDNMAQCMSRLKEAEFFNTPGRNLVLMFKVTNALDLHAFFGPEGNWARKRAPDVRKAMLEQSYIDKGQANGRSYQSTFMRKGTKNRPSAAFWQKFADFCAEPNLASIGWHVCELNLFNNAIDIPRNNAFPHRDGDVITHYIIGEGSDQDRMSAYKWMKKHFDPYTIGVYVNYPELELKDYAKAYWGESLGRLRMVKARYDPNLFFYNPQPIPPAA